MNFTVNSSWATYTAHLDTIKGIFNDPDPKHDGPEACNSLGIIPDFVMGKIVVKNIYKCFILGVFLELNNTKKSKTLYSNICY